MKRPNSKPPTRKELIEELSTFIDSIGTVPVDHLLDFSNTTEKYAYSEAEQKFEDLVDLCQNFVSDAREKMEEIATDIALPKKKRSWL